MTTTVQVAQVFGENLIKKAIVTVIRNDGSEVCITAECHANVLTGKVELDYFVRARPNNQSDWMFCNNIPASGFKTMSLSDYMTRGRSKLFQVITGGELLKVLNLLGEPRDKAQGFTLSSRTVAERDKTVSLRHFTGIATAA